MSKTKSLQNALIPQVVSTARIHLLGLFALTGLGMSNWLSRLPAIREILHLSEAELGVLLLAGAGGALLTATLAGGIMALVGSKKAMHISTAGTVTALLCMTAAVQFHSVWLLAAGICINGAAFSLNNVPFNVETAVIERRMGRTVIPQFHASFSIGALAGTLIGAGCAFLNIPVQTQFLTCAALFLIWRIWSVKKTVLDTHQRVSVVKAGYGKKNKHRDVSSLTQQKGDRQWSTIQAWKEPRTLLIGAVILAASLSEGAANDWLAIAVVDGFNQTQAVGALIFGVFIGAMTVFRIVGTNLIDRQGRVKILRISGVSAIVGLLLFGFANWFPLAIVGVAIWGFGAALAYPIGIAAASEDAKKAAARVAVVSAFASIASLGAPPALGFIANHIGARHALLFIIAALVVSLLASGATRETKETNKASEPEIPQPDEAATSLVKIG